MPQLRFDQRVQLSRANECIRAFARQGLIVRIESWNLVGEKMSRLALHVHGDKVAQGKSDEIIKAVAALRNNRHPLSLEALSEAVAAIGKAHGLVAYASSAKCFYDPLETVIDTSFYEPSAD